MMERTESAQKLYTQLRWWEFPDQYLIEPTDGSSASFSLIGPSFVFLSLSASPLHHQTFHQSSSIIILQPDQIISSTQTSIAAAGRTINTLSDSHHRQHLNPSPKQPITAQQPSSSNPIAVHHQTSDFPQPDQQIAIPPTATPGRATPPPAARAFVFD